MPLLTGKRHVSYSEVKDWAECSYRHKLKYIDKLSTFEANEFTTFGKALHSVLEEYIKTRIVKPEIALAYLCREWGKYGYPDMSLWMERINLCVAAMADWLDETFPGWECVDAEENLMEVIPDSEHENVKFKGFIDAVIKWNGYYYLIDWKTAGNGWATQKRNDKIVQLQLVFYNAFWSRKHKVDPKKIKCAFVLFNREKEAKERCELVDMSVSQGECDKALELVGDMIASVKRGRHMKAWKRGDPTAWKGVCMFCEFDSTEHCFRP